MGPWFFRTLRTGRNAFKTHSFRRLSTRLPFLQRFTERMISWAKYFVPPVWVRVERGLAKGAWLQLRLPGKSTYWEGTHEPQTQDLLNQWVLPSTVAYDIGAHLGLFALGMAKCVGPNGVVLAFEPDPESASRLRENIVRNGLQGRVQVVEAAVWSHSGDGLIPFRRGSRARSHGGVEADGSRAVLATGEVIKVPVVTLDEFIQRGHPVPQLMKIDVEGGEYHVLRGASDLLRDRRPIVVIDKVTRGRN